MVCCLPKTAAASSAVVMVEDVRIADRTWPAAPELKLNMSTRYVESTVMYTKT